MKKPFFILFVLVSTWLSAQTSANLNGKVTDAASGETLTGVSISVQGVAKLTTDFDGYFDLSSLKPGVYSIVCKYLSYADKIVEVEIKAGETTFLPIVMNEAGFDATEGISTTSIPTNGTSSN